MHALSRMMAKFYAAICTVHTEATEMVMLIPSVTMAEELGVRVMAMVHTEANEMTMLMPFRKAEEQGGVILSVRAKVDELDMVILFVPVDLLRVLRRTLVIRAARASVERFVIPAVPLVLGLTGMDSMTANVLPLLQLIFVVMAKVDEVDMVILFVPVDLLRVLGRTLVIRAARASVERFVVLIVPLVLGLTGMASMMATPNDLTCPRLLQLIFVVMSLVLGTVTATGLCD